MWPNWFDVPVRSLVATCRMVHARSLSVVGSAAAGPGAVGDSGAGRVPGDLDLHLVLPRWTPAVADGVLGALGTALQDLAAIDGAEYRLELRHGPFKPPPDRRINQVHLLADDDLSLQRSPWVLRWHRAVTGHPLFGRPDVPAPCPVQRQLREARRELLRWRDGLLNGQIPFRQWQGGRDPQLVDGRAAVTSEWERRCLIRAARASVDLHVRALAVLRGPPGQIARTAWRGVPPAAPDDLDAEREIARINSSLELLSRVREGIRRDR